MWKWDQGRMEYFQYDILKTVARFTLNHDFKNASPALIRSETGLAFAAPSTHSPWRNYSRIFKLCLIVSEKNGVAVPTPIASVLADSGTVTCDEYMHFLVEVVTDPSPALSDWAKISDFSTLRNPLCFSLKYLLAKVAGLNEFFTPINEIIGAYISSGFTGQEDDTAFLSLMPNRDQYPAIANSVDPRQARESIKFISQISYLHIDSGNVIAALSQEDAFNIFHEINPIHGNREPDGNNEIQRLAALFKDGSVHDFFDYKETIISDVVESGFSEGSKVKKTHIVIERNAKLRDTFFKNNPTSKCDACNLDTNKKYPWVERVLDLHHVLPLSSGTRVDSRKGTLLSDLVPVCPSCHRAVHRFYDAHLKSESRKDFTNEKEARAIYAKAKSSITEEGIYA